MRDRNASVVHRSQHVVRDRAVQIEVVAEKGVDCRDNPWPALDRESDVTAQCLVEDRVQGGLIERTPIGETAYARAVGRRELHGGNGRGMTPPRRPFFV